MPFLLVRTTDTSHYTNSQQHRAREVAGTGIFYAFTGCDTVAFFSNRGKKSAWQAWQAYPEATDAFRTLCSRPPDVPKTVIETLERFVVLIYDRTPVNFKV